MIWIEESPTSALDDDSDVPFDERPGKPMACEEEIELIIKPDDDEYPLKALEADEDTWPETLSASGATSTLVSSDDGEKDAGQSTTDDKHSEAANGAEDVNAVPLETIDDDATRVMGENRTVEGPEDDRTFSSFQDASLVYLATKIFPEASGTLVGSPEDSPQAPSETSSPFPQDENQDIQIEGPETSALASTSSGKDEEMQISAESTSIAQQDAGRTLAPAEVVEDDAENDAPDLVSESLVAGDEIVDDVDAAEHDVVSMSESETKPLHEMDEEEDAPDSYSQQDWYDQWDPLEDTTDGISCISNMFASIKSASTPTEDGTMEDQSLSSPIIATVVSTDSQVAMKSTQGEQYEQPHEAADLRETSKPEPKMEKQVILIFEGGDDSGNASAMTLTDFLDANCMQGSRKERRKRIMERQRSALSRITPIVASSAPGSCSTSGPGFLDHLFEFDPIEQLQNIWGLGE